VTGPTNLNSAIFSDTQDVACSCPTNVVSRLLVVMIGMAG